MKKNEMRHFSLSVWGWPFDFAKNPPLSPWDVGGGGKPTDKSFTSVSALNERLKVAKNHRQNIMETYVFMLDSFQPCRQPMQLHGLCQTCSQKSRHVA